MIDQNQTRTKFTQIPITHAYQELPTQNHKDLSHLHLNDLGFLRPRWRQFLHCDGQNPILTFRIDPMSVRIPCNANFLINFPILPSILT